MEFSMKMKYLLFILSALTLTSSIRVPSSWQQEYHNDRSRSRGIRPHKNNSQVHRRYSNGVKHLYDRAQITPLGYIDPSIQKHNWTRRNANKQLVKQNSPMNETPFLKKPISRKSFRPSHQDKSHLEFYMIPKPVSHRILSNSRSQQYDLPLSQNTPEKVSQNIQATVNFLPFPQSKISYKQNINPQLSPTFTDWVPSFGSTDQFPETFADQRIQNELPSITTSNPLSQNFDQFFNVPPNREFVKHIQNHKLDNPPYNNFEGDSQKPKFNEDTKEPFQVYNINSVATNVPPQKVIQKSDDSGNHDSFENHFFKNYRDDRTHEPIDFDPFLEQADDSEIKREESEKAPISSHEYPADIPTKPIYPGPGKWAKPGVKYRPFISRQKYDKLEEQEETPEGYDTFLEGKELFTEFNNKFDKNLNSFPEKHKLGQFLKNETPNKNEMQDDSEVKENSGTVTENENQEGEEKEFVPTRMYAQVRHTEGIQRLPAEQAEEPRLRESIKESKIQTVYTEEGYEDSAYDHAGHEKSAENEEGFEEHEKEKVRKIEKKVPAHKYNLHLKPKYESTAYGNENDLPTDEEIEQYKREELGIEDAEEAGSQFGISPNSINNLNGEEKRTMRTNNDFMSTKEEKTMTTMGNDNGDTETEISSRVKIIHKPNNHTRAHEFVKIYPKTFKVVSGKHSNTVKPSEEIIARVEELPKTKQNLSNTVGFYIEEIITTTTEIPITTIPPSDSIEIFTEEIPITTLATTAIPTPKGITPQEVIPETLDSIEKAFWSIAPRSRKKRFVNDFPKIEVDTDFISKINHHLGESKEESLEQKYPYYDKSEEHGINENSPLRYSENLNNIPQKKEGNMAFYEHAEKMIVCPEIDSTVEPIPERIENANKDNSYPEGEDIKKEEREDGNQSEQTTKLPQQPKSPRLTGLGDKIQCLRAKYFGRNPLDSPFFQEETVGTIKPIFKILEKANMNNEKEFPVNEGRENEISTDHEDSEKAKNGIDSNFGTATTVDTPTTMDVEKLKSNVYQDVTKNMKKMFETEHKQTSSVQTVPTISLLTTPEYTVDLKPKHIYDQIKLLKYLPENQNLSSTSAGSNNFQIPSEFELGITQSTIISERQPKYNKGDEEDLSYDSSVDSPSISENLTYEFPEEGSILPDAEALRRRRKFRYRRKRPAIKRILSTTSFPIFGNYLTTSTVLPKYKVVSEVFYKDDIKPNEQLNVFTDILNNIRNSSQEAADEVFQNLSEPITVALDSKSRVDQLKMIQKYKDDSYLKAYGDQEIDNTNYDLTSTTTARPFPSEGTALYNTDFIRNRLKQTVHPKDKFKLYAALLDAQNKKISGLVPNISPVISSPPVDVESQDDTTMVMGLMPPRKHQYKTILHSKQDNQVFIRSQGDTEKKVMNNFLVMGMKPPPKQRIFVYSDFQDRNSIRTRRVPSRRGKRDTNRSSYAELTRNQAAEKTDEVEDEDDDDYVPHRPKNYYYDEKTGKIVYNKDNKSEEKSDEEVEYIEIVEEPPETTPKPEPKQNPIFATATPPPEGQSYIDFVNKLKSAPDYTLIPDPTTTERGAEVSTEKVFTTKKPELTEPPEFFNILGKVRQSGDYKFIADEKNEDKVVSTTSESPEEIIEEDVEEESIPTNVKNSPGGVQHDLLPGLQIFDISDYIPKLKSYLPRTSFDTSKYKTISRPTVSSTSKTESISEEEKVSQINNTPVSEVKSSSEQIENSQASNTNNSPVFIDSTDVEDVIDSGEKEVTTVSPSTVTATSNRQQHPIKHTHRRRPTTSRSVVNTRRSIPTTSLSPVTPESDTEHYPKSRRNYRRRPTRIKVTSTTESLTDDDTDETTKILRRRSNLQELKQKESVILSSTVRAVTNELSIDPKKYVEIFKKYNQNKRHGGNYRKSDKDEVTPNQSVVDADPISDRKSKDVEIISEYDKDKRHGGNYKKEDTSSIERNMGESIEDNSKEEALIVDLLPEDSLPEDSLTDKTTMKIASPKTGRQSRKPKRILIKQVKKYEVNKPVNRLTDVVTKPETFYTDPTLPMSVNMLAKVDALSSEEVRKFEGMESSSEETDIDAEDKTESANSNTTKKPTFIVDPSKRLYFYAPI
ncbi:uncharacterized protein [Leptinotarsa decemlineata]|uniref:uncharacterized protein n=1 Tax=Leptinotarsa decemlineata TaxID=7539 RepID=UPI003D306889